MTNLKARLNITGSETWHDISGAGGEFTVDIPASVGTGTLEIQANDGTRLTQIPYVSVGTCDGGVGQSNMKGSSENKHNYSANNSIGLYDPRPTPMALMVGRTERDTWGAAYDEGWIPEYLDTQQTTNSRPWGMVRFAIGSTKISQWLKTAPVDAAGYGYSVRYYDELVRAVLVSQGFDPAAYDPATMDPPIRHLKIQIGEADAKASTSKASFKADLKQFAADINADLGVSCVVSVLQDLFSTGYVATEAQLTAIQDAVTEAATESAYITVGPDFSDVVLDTDPPEQSGNVHFYTDTQVALAASRWSNF